MKQINILDCTLRDGGYINNFDFGENIIKKIINKLSQASIDIIECGFLKSNVNDNNKTLFKNTSDIKKILGKKNYNLLYVAMIQYGNISNDEIEYCDGTSIDGIRLTFHEHEIEDAFVLGKQLMAKGYKLFMQPVGTNTYTDISLLQLISKINELMPFAFYLVDTMGTIYKNDLLRFVYLIDNNLDKKVALGFHSHNNLQLSFSNAQELIQLNLQRKIIIDTSVLGMGRGAGNLCTELMTQYINTNFELYYDNLKILEIMDEYITPLKIKYNWGYDPAYYLASTMQCHPNYASFLLNKQTLSIPDIKAILNNMEQEKRKLYDVEYIRKLYLEHMEHNINDKDTIKKLVKLINKRDVLILAPGKSLRNSDEKLNKLMKEKKPFVISVNFIPKDISVDILFISNRKRFENLDELSVDSIITSNIKIENKENQYIINFSDYINEEPCIADNAGLMCINLMKNIGVEKVILAGFDGFDMNRQENYYEDKMILNVEKERLDRMNKATMRKINQLKLQIKIEFLTKSIYE